ncbi:MAG TPA: hypothetical protein VHJ83_00050 [Micromonosporaceae bacterium]|nr:hypothetical protein [Micromonosporaceae bacterium]
MSLGLRAATVVLLVASYGIVGTAAQAVAEPTVIVAASADDIRIKLPVRYVSDLVVDTVHQRVYVSSGEGLTKLNFAGQILETGRTSYGDLALAPDASALSRTSRCSWAATRS